MTRTVRYHSRAWIELVEQGWVTLQVTNGFAVMRELAMLQSYRSRRNT